MIPDKEPVNTWDGNSSNITFDFDFLINSEKELLVLHTDKTGIQNTLKLNIDYTIHQTGNADGSYITFPILGSSYKTLGEGEKITLMLNIPIAQTSPYGTSGKLNLKSLEFSLDYIVRLIQMVNRKAERSVKVQEGSSTTPDDLIESLNQAQMNAQNSANFAATKVQEANNSAIKAEEQAEIATSQAQIATDKVIEIDDKLITKVNIDLDNLSEAGQQVIAKYSASFSLFDTKLSDHVLEGDEAVGWALQGSLVTNTYPAAVNAIKTAYASGTDETFTLGDITFPYKKAQNGWQIADIAQKDNVDALFTQTGVAKFYVLDSANNQFYLPRETFFRQLTNDPNNVNQYNEAGLPNIKGQFSSGRVSLGSTNGAFKEIGQLEFGVTIEKLPTTSLKDFDASRSSSIYGNSDTVQPQSSNWLLYYVVGNTITNESEIDVGNVLSDLQLKADIDLANVTAAGIEKVVGWLQLNLEAKIYTAEVQPYTIPVDCFCNIFIGSNEQNKTASIERNGVATNIYIGGTYPEDILSTSMILKKGDIFKTNIDSFALDIYPFIKQRSLQ